MGGSMCSHILHKGYPVTVNTRSKEKAQGLLDHGAKWGDTPRAVGEQSDIVFTIVGFPSDVRQVYFDAAGLLPAARAGQIFVDMTTTEPTLAKEIYETAKKKGADGVDAPVSGGDVGAKNATLTIMIGGDKPTVDTLMPLFETMGKRILYQGGPGAGQHVKMCNQIQIAGAMVGMCEALLYGHKAGLDLATMVETIKGGAAAYWGLEHLAPRVLKRDFEPGFIVEHFIKDMGIALSEAQRMGLAMPGLALVHQLYLALKAQGHGRRGTQALVLALEHISNLDRPAVVA